MNWNTLGYCAATMLWAMAAALWLGEAARKEGLGQKLLPFLAGIVYMLTAIYFLYRAVGGQMQ